MDQEVKLSQKHKQFCIEYLKDLNGTQAAIRTGYSAKTAKAIASRLLTNVNLQSYIKKLRSEQFKKDIATAEEVEALLSKTLRGELNEEVVVTVLIGDGSSVAKTVTKQVSAKDRIKAAELMGRRHQLFVDKVQVESDVVPVILEDVPNE